MSSVRKRLRRSAGGVFARAVRDRDLRNGAAWWNAEHVPTAREEDRAVGAPAAIDARCVCESDWRTLFGIGYVQHFQLATGEERKPRAVRRPERPHRVLGAWHGQGDAGREDVLPDAFVGAAGVERQAPPVCRDRQAGAEAVVREDDRELKERLL